MGARSVRITRSDFLTPPEFQGREPDHHPAGRVGGARVELIHTGNETRMGTCYQQIPAPVFPPFVFSHEQAALLYLINLTAGLMDGDAHHYEVTAREGTRAIVTGQSATRVHPAQTSYATQQWSVVAEEGACLILLPGPVIPFRGSRYYQRARAELAPGARLIWGDIWFPGRYERGALSERFEFDRIVQDFEVRRNGVLAYRERFRWDGPWNAADVAWHFGDALACASLYVGGPIPDQLPDAPPDVCRSLFPFENGDNCLRWCGPPASVTTDLVNLSLQLAANWTVGPGAAPWWVASSSLAPNHWFSSFEHS